MMTGGIWSGAGREINEKGDTFEGTYLRDKKEGKGKQTIKITGTIYEGTWANDLKQGNFKVTTTGKDGTHILYKLFQKDAPGKSITEEEYKKGN